MSGVTGSNYEVLESSPDGLFLYTSQMALIRHPKIKIKKKLCLPWDLVFSKLLGVALMWLFYRWTEGKEGKQL